MRPIWKGSVSFGLVNIPIALLSATRREELSFRLLRKSDLSPINYRRVAEADGKEVEWKDIVKGYEYEKGRFVVLREEDFRRADVEATETIDIMDFVPASAIDPMMFSRPYYLSPLKGGAKAYALLHAALEATGKVGITKVVIKTRQHLAALKANRDVLVLDLMHFPEELIPPQNVEKPAAGAKPSKRELTMATTLINQMSTAWEPERYHDDYKSALLKMIEQKIQAGGKELPAAPRGRRAGSDVIDLVAVLQESLTESGRAKRPARKSTARKRSSRSGARKSSRRAAA